MQEDKAVYGIMGNPVKHSLSPVMHNAAFKALNVDATYKLFPLEEDELKDFFDDLKNEASPIFGLNVTAPYKQKVLEYLDDLSPLAKKIKAVNTIGVTDKRVLTGYNTDAPGFITHLAELQFNTADKSIAILGAGGSARAILATLCMIPERPGTIKVYNRTVSRTKDLMDDLKSEINLDVVDPVCSIEELDITRADLLINTTSIGMNEDDPQLIEESLLHPDLLVYDLIYNPKETLLLKMAREQGAQTANGLGMLYYQGVLSFQHWADMELSEPVKNIMRESLEEAAEYE